MRRIADDERPKYERYNNEQLVLHVAHPGIKGILKLNPTAECLDFSRTGLKFASNQPLKINANVVLDLLIFDIELDEIRGEIISHKPLDNGQCCHGVSFCDKRMSSPDIAQKLLLIEDRLRTAQQYPIASTNS